MHEVKSIGFDEAFNLDVFQINQKRKLPFVHLFNAWFLPQTDYIAISNGKYQNCTDISSTS